MAISLNPILSLLCGRVPIHLVHAASRMKNEPGQREWACPVLDTGAGATAASSHIVTISKSQQTSALDKSDLSWQIPLGCAIVLLVYTRLEV